MIFYASLTILRIQQIPIEINSFNRGVFITTSTTLICFPSFQLNWEMISKINGPALLFTAQAHNSTW